MVIDYGSFANATSLNLIAKKIFYELGKIMNEQKNFTIAALRYDDVGIGDVNQHYDCIYIPNMGGYRFPSDKIMTAKNVIIGLIGIDEVILGEKVFRTKIDWERNKPIIEREIPKWKTGAGRINIIHVATNSEKEQMIRYLQIPNEKIRIIPLGVDHEKFRPSEKKEERRIILGKFFLKDSPYFIHVSETNWARKNIFRVLEAFEKVKKKEGIKHKLIIVGRTEQVVFEKASQIPDVKTLGFVSEEHLISLIKNADAMVFPSLHEGFGLPSVEAISCGVPVIASDVFSSPEVLGNGALYVDPYDVDDIAEKLELIALDETIRKDISEKALIQSKKYSWSNTAKQILDLITEKTETKGQFDFDKHYEIAALRTLATITEMTPHLTPLTRMEFLEFNYDIIITWCVEVGLQEENLREFLMPYKEFLIKRYGGKC